MPFSVFIQQVADADLGPLLTKLADEGYPNPVVELNGSTARSKGDARSQAAGADDLPSEWRLVLELEGQSYRWPEVTDEFSRYLVYAGETRREGAVRIAIGFAPRANAWGRDREYVVAFLTGGAPQTPLVEFLETDDHAETGEYLAIIRGSDGGRRMYGPADSLPDVYVQSFRTEIYKDRIEYPGSWGKVAVIAHKADHSAMLNHALVQARRRGDL